MSDSSFYIRAIYNKVISEWPSRQGQHNKNSKRWKYTLSQVCLLLFYVLATSKVISGRVLTCDSVHSWRLYSITPMGNHAFSTVTWYRTQSHYPYTEPTSPCSLLIRPNTWLESDKYQFYKPLIWLNNLPQARTRVLPIRPLSQYPFWCALTCC